MTIKNKTAARPAANAKRSPVKAKVTTVTATPVKALTGKRADAFANIAQLSFVEGMSRADTLANLRVVLGKSPDEKALAAAQAQWQIGYIAQRLATNAKTGTTAASRIAYAGKVMLTMAAPPKDGTAARKLRAGQTGRRSAIEQKAVRASVSAWSLVKAELGLSEAKTIAEKNATQAKATASRAPHHNAKASDARAGSVDKVAQLPPAKAMTGAILSDHVTTQLAALRSLCDKHAAIMPLEFGDVVAGLATLRNKAVDAKRAYEKRLAANAGEAKTA